MKIDFNGKGMSIDFDKVPNFLYFNEEGKGCGNVFLNGVQRKGLQDIVMKAHTRDDKGWPLLRYKIQYHEKGNFESSILSTMQDELCVNVKIIDTDIFVSFLNSIGQMMKDKRIPENVRSEYTNKLLKPYKAKATYQFYSDAGLEFEITEDENNV